MEKEHALANIRQNATSGCNICRKCEFKAMRGANSEEIKSWIDCRLGQRRRSRVNRGGSSLPSFAKFNIQVGQTFLSSPCSPVTVPASLGLVHVIGRIKYIAHKHLIRKPLKHLQWLFLQRVRHIPRDVSPFVSSYCAGSIRVSEVIAVR